MDRLKVDKVNLDYLNIEIKCFISSIDSDIDSEKKDIKMYEKFLKETQSNNTKDDDFKVIYELEKESHYKDLILEKTLKIKLLERYKEVVERMSIYSKNLVQGVDDYEQNGYKSEK